MDKRWHQTESRWGDRVRVDIPVEISSNSCASAGGSMKNLSLSGALVKADVQLGMHSMIQVIMTGPAPAFRASSVSAYVSRQLAEGVGVEWCEFAPGVVKEWLRAQKHGSNGQGFGNS